MSSDESVFLVIIVCMAAGLGGGVHLHSNGLSLGSPTSCLWGGGERCTPGCSLGILNIH